MSDEVQYSVILSIPHFCIHALRQADVMNGLLHSIPQLKWKFADADDYHSEENKAKMSQRIPLTDEVRL